MSTPELEVLLNGFLPKIRTNNDILIIKFDRAQNDQCYSVGDSSFDKIGLGGVVALN